MKKSQLSKTKILRPETKIPGTINDNVVAIAITTVIAVSYTHLDVYKRQT